jgi:hypothetical protein
VKTVFSTAAVLVALAISPASATAQVATDEASDIECLAATLLISQNAEEPLAGQAMSAVMYFIGKVTARGIDYTDQLEIALREMTNDGLAAASERCGAELEYVGTDMQRRGAEIQARDELRLQQ